MATHEELRAKTKEELVELARERDLEGRSGLNKEELVDALADGDEKSTSQGADERKAELEEKTPEAAELAAEEMDLQGPLHLQSPEERIMTGAVSEDQAKEQEQLLADKPDNHVGEVTDAGYNTKGDVKPVSVTEPVMQYAIDYKKNALEADLKEAKNSSGDTDEA